MKKTTVVVLWALVAVLALVLGAVLLVERGKEKAATEARVACGFIRPALANDPGKTESFVKLMLGQASKHAAEAASRDRAKYAAFAGGVETLRFNHATGARGTTGILDIEPVCGKLV